MFEIAHLILAVIAVIVPGIGATVGATWVLSNKIQKDTEMLSDQIHQVDKSVHGHEIRIKSLETKVERESQATHKLRNRVFALESIKS